MKVEPMEICVIQVKLTSSRTTTISQLLYMSACVILHPQLKLGGFLLYFSLLVLSSTLVKNQNILTYFCLLTEPLQS